MNLIPSKTNPAPLVTGNCRHANWWWKLELSHLGLLTADWSVFKWHINKNQTYLFNNILWWCIWHLGQRPNWVTFNFYHMAATRYFYHLPIAAVCFKFFLVFLYTISKLRRTAIGSNYFGFVGLIPEWGNTTPLRDNKNYP